MNCKVKLNFWKFLYCVWTSVHDGLLKLVDFFFFFVIASSASFLFHSRVNVFVPFMFVVEEMCLPFHQGLHKNSADQYLGVAHQYFLIFWKDNITCMTWWLISVTCKAAQIAILWKLIQGTLWPCYRCLFLSVTPRVDSLASLKCTFIFSFRWLWHQVASNGNEHYILQFIFILK